MDIFCNTFACFRFKIRMSYSLALGGILPAIPDILYPNNTKNVISLQMKICAFLSPYMVIFENIFLVF